MIVKQTKKLFLCLCILLTAFFTGAATAYAMEGEGTKENPYKISSKDDLLEFAEKVNYGDYWICAQLTENIVLNDETFTFDPDTGLVIVTDGKNVGYLGTGQKGEAGGNETFDTEASEAGKWYLGTAGTAEGSYGGEIEEWTPIRSNTDNSYKGIFDGNNKTISGVYVNITEDNAGLFGEVQTVGEVKNLNVTASYIHGKNKVGGICCSNSGTLMSCYNTGIVIGFLYNGGISGFNYGTVT